MRRFAPGFLLLAAVASSSLGAGWPEFRGHGRSGSALDGAIPVLFGPGTNLLWRTPVPSGNSSPVTAGDRIFLTAFETNRLLTLGFDGRTGRELWRSGLEPGRFEPGSRLSNPASATACTDGERVVVYFAPFGLAAYDLAGSELWRTPLPTPVTQHGASSSPVLAGDLVLQQCDQDVDSYLLAIDKRTGVVRWRVERPSFRRGFSTPLPWPPDKPGIVVVAGTLRLAAYELATGAERWSVDGLPNEMVASPVGGDGFVFVAGWTHGSGVPRMPAWDQFATESDADRDGVLTRDETPNGPARQHFQYMDVDRDGRLSRAEYEGIATIFDRARNVAMAVRPDGSGDVTETHVRWRQTRGLPYVPTPLLHRGRLYFVRNGGIVSCLDPATGAFVYQEERLGALGDYYASPVAAGDRILAVAQPGTAVVFRAGDTLDVLARNALGEEVVATPAIVGATLYVRTKATLFAFAEGAAGRPPAVAP